MYKGVIFDMDGLMFDSESAYLKANIQAGKAMGIPVTKSEYLELVGASEIEAEDFIAAHFKTKQEQDDFYALTEKYVLEMLAQEKLQERPGLHTLLTYLDAHHYARVIASSNNLPIISAFMNHFHLQQDFPVIVSREQVSASKPAPDIFLTAQKKLGLPKQDLLILEDSPNGVIAANRANIDVIMIPDLIQPTSKLRQLATAIVPDLEKVIPFL